MLLKKYKNGGKAKKKTTATNIETYEQIGSGVIDYPPSGRKTLKKQSGSRKREWGTSPNKSPGTETLMKGREFRKGLEGAPDLDGDLWAKYQKKGYLVLPQLVKEQRARDAHGKATKRTKAIEKATGLKYPKSAGGSLPLGEGGKKTTDMPHGAMIMKQGFKGKVYKSKYKPRKKAKLLKKAQLLKKKEIA